jgi:hypothetical protein
MIRKERNRVLKWIHTESMQPEINDLGVPLCDERCPSHDGKRCRLLGLPPSIVCEPAVAVMAQHIARCGEAASQS